MKIPEKYVPYFLVMPAFLVLVGILYPFGLGIYYSFTDITFVDPSPDFVGLENWINMFTGGAFWNALRINLMYAFGSTAITMIIGFFVAYYLDKFELKWIRSILIIPFMIPPMTAALMWRVMMRPGHGGIINYLLYFIGVGPFAFLSNVRLALPSVVIIDAWVFTPFAILILYAGIRAVPRDLIDAAKVDGANELNRIRHIIIPSMKTHILIALTFRFIDSLKLFDIVYTATRGGPAGRTETLHIRSYFETIRWLNLGEGMPYLIVLWGMCFISARYLISKW